MLYICIFSNKFDLKQTIRVLHNYFNSVYCLNYQLSTGNQCLLCFIQISTPKPGLLHLMSHPYCKKGRLAKVKDGIRNYILRNYLID